jgi:diguanylate cyclase (GGDEF)-like protein/PAS domain S-box-containing protein
MIDLVPHFIFAKDSDGRFVLANRALAEAYGSTPEQLEGKTDADFAKSQEEAAHFRAEDLAVIQSGNASDIEEVITDSSGRQRTLHTVKIPFSYEGTTRPGLLGVAIDISAQKVAQQRIAYLAHHDDLTGLPNRLELEAFLQRRLSQGLPFALLFLDFDHFKDINDSLGHGIGDVFLKLMAQRIGAWLTKGDFVCRIGGDEFVVVLRHAESPLAQTKVETLLQLLREPVAIDSLMLSSTCSVGAALFPNDGASTETLMKNADAALYSAKAQGRNGAQFFSAALYQAADRRLAMLNGLRTAAAHDEFTLHFQPILDTHTNRWLSVEALLRWKSKQLGNVGPAEFISLAEETGLITSIGQWVLHAACAQQASWASRGIKMNISVNISARQLLVPTFESEFRAFCQETGAKPEHLTFEITEGVLLTDVAAAQRVLNSLAHSGVMISVDDFGVGYSSLSYLRKLPISFLKIDRSFVTDCHQNADDLAIIRGVIAIAKALRLKVVAEGVETEAQATLLRSEGCNALQGYLFARPMTAEALTSLIAST